MPLKSDSLGSLEIVDKTVDPAFLQKLNSRLRRVGQFAATTTSTSAAAAAPSGASGRGQLILASPGTLAVQSNVAPVITLGANTTFATALLYLKQAPQGGAVTVQLYVAGAAYGPQLAIGGTSATVSLAGLPAILANAIIRLDVTGVPTGGTNFPGADLTVILR